MARIGINPTRNKLSTYYPARVTATIITFIPALDGYFRDKLDVLKLTLRSLRTRTAVEHDLLVFDNASCQPVRDYLIAQQQSGMIDYLLLSHQNIGKIGAFQIIFKASPGEIIAYCDDDILFYPGWLEAQMEILDHFPGVGMISGVPVRNASGHAGQTLKHFMEKPPPGIQVVSQKRIPENWERDWAISTGRNPAEHLDATREHQDILLCTHTPDGKLIEAIGSANHFQFIGLRNVLKKALPKNWSGRLMGSMIEFDEAIDALGLLRLSTVQRYTRHIGNTLSETMQQEALELGLNGDFRSAEPSLRAKHKHWLLRVPGLRRILVLLYDKLFEIIYR